jgi:hypothetical protein
MCMLERYFPPSFFDIMVHLTIHLGRKLIYVGRCNIVGCIHLRGCSLPFFLNVYVRVGVSSIHLILLCYLDI